MTPPADSGAKVDIYTSRHSKEDNRLFQTTLATFGAVMSGVRPMMNSKYAARLMLLALGLILMLSIVAGAQPAARTNVREFFRGITGEWIGTCQQNTDGQQADDKYFHAIIREVTPDSFSTQFDYYRVDDKTGGLVKIGTSSVATCISADGTAKNRITGTGEVLVDNKPKKQQHDLTELLSYSNAGSLQAQGNGTLSVSGMPLGLGKNGKVRNDKSMWSLNNGVLCIKQNLNVAFRALFFTKSFNVTAIYTAQRGANVACLLNKPGMYGSGNGAGKHGE